MSNIFISIANLINSFANAICEMDFIDVLMVFLIVLLFTGKAPDEFQKYAYQWIGTLLVYLTSKKYHYEKQIWQYISNKYYCVLSKIR
jgi:hypothetical protein